MMTVFTGKITITAKAKTMGLGLTLVEKAFSHASTREARGSSEVVSFDGATETGLGVDNIYRVRLTVEVEAHTISAAGTRINQMAAVDGLELVSLDSLKTKGRE